MKACLKFAAAAVVAVGMFAASSAHAAGQVKINNVDAWGTGSAGGPFDITVTGLPGGNGTFLSFCLERKETISKGGVYDANLSTEAKFNGNGTIDPLDARTAFLYTAFRNGTLDDEASGAGFTWAYGNADGGTDSYGAALQNAIWYLENEIGSVSGLAQSLVTLSDNSGWTTLGNVRVINLWTKGTLPTMSSTNARQDLLVMVPTPEALVGGLGLLGVLGAARLRRRPSIMD